MLQTYADDKKRLADHDWTITRQTLHVIEDFLDKWGKVFQSNDYDDGAQKTLLKEIILYEACMPVLSCLKGLSWEPRHSTQLLTLLNLSDQVFQKVQRTQTIVSKLKIESL